MSEEGFTKWVVLFPLTYKITLPYTPSTEKQYLINSVTFRRARLPRTGRRQASRCSPAAK